MTKPTITQLLEEYVYTHQQKFLSVDDLLNSISRRSYGLLLLILALPNALLLTSIPGTSTFFGIPICFIALQIIINRPSPWIPDRIRYSQVSRETLLKILRKSSTYLLKIEHYVRPRWTFLTQKVMERIIGIFLLILGIIIALPIPFGNFFGGLGVIFLSLALIQADGVFALAGILLTLFICFVIFRFAGSVIVYINTVF